MTRSEARALRSEIKLFYQTFGWLDKDCLDCLVEKKEVFEVRVLFQFSSEIVGEVIGELDVSY